MDVDDLEEGGLRELAVRTGRTFENLPANPLYGRVLTVGDLVEFFGHQPHVQRPNKPRQPTSGEQVEVE
jgi:hypothetical protein